MCLNDDNDEGTSNSHNRQGNTATTMSEISHDDDNNDDNNVKSEEDKTSMHLTFNFDTCVWDLNYLSIRRLALRRAAIKDTLLGQDLETDNPCIGAINSLPKDKLHDILSSLPLDFLDDTKTSQEQTNIINHIIYARATITISIVVLESLTILNNGAWHGETVLGI